MDLSAIIVILVLTALSFGALVWLEMSSRRRRPKEASADNAAGVDGNNGDTSV